MRKLNKTDNGLKSEFLKLRKEIRSYRLHEKKNSSIPGHA